MGDPCSIWKVCCWQISCYRQPGTVESTPKGPLDRVVGWLTKEITSALTGKLCWTAQGECVYAEIMTEGTHPLGFSGKQRIRNEATERHTSGLWRMRQGHGKSVLASESESETGLQWCPVPYWTLSPAWSAGDNWDRKWTEGNLCISLIIRSKMIREPGGK